MTDPGSFWERRAAWYARRPVADEGAWRTTLARTRAHLAPGMEVLEIGCGTGTAALELAPAVRRYLATDPSAAMTGIAAGKVRAAALPGLEVRRAAPGDAALAGRRFDAVVAFNLLHLVADLPALLAQVRGMLAPGGLFVSKTPCLKGQGVHLRVLLGALRLAGMAPAMRFLAPEALQAAIRDGGFAIVESGDHPARPPRRFVVARAV